MKKEYEKEVWDACIASLEGISSSSVHVFLEVLGKHIGHDVKSWVAVAETESIWYKLKDYYPYVRGSVTFTLNLSEDIKEMLFIMYSERIFWKIFEDNPKLAHLCDIVCFVYSVYFDRDNGWYVNGSLQSTYSFMWKLLHLYNIKRCVFSDEDYEHFLCIFIDDEELGNEVALIINLLLRAGRDPSSDDSFICIVSPMCFIDDWRQDRVQLIDVDY